MAASTSELHGRLTARELDVGLLLLQGMGTGEIARKLGKQPSTISTQARRLYDKLGIQTPQQFTLKRDEWMDILGRLRPAASPDPGDGGPPLSVS
jgi:DNA-binding CsgD family transcriptional regulator